MYSNDAVDYNNESIGSTTAPAAQYEHDGPNDGQLRHRSISYVISDSISSGQNVVNS